MVLQDMEDTEPLSLGCPAVVMWDTESLSWGHTAAMSSPLTIVEGHFCTCEKQIGGKTNNLGSLQCL